jgi:hypothetical protein
MSVAENIDLVRRFYSAGPADDDSARAEFAASDVVWHVPGANQISGRYQGYSEVFTEIGERMQPLDVWTIEVDEVMGNADMIVAVVTVTAARGAHHVACKGAHVFRFAPDGRIAEVWGFVDDQETLDALFSS